MTTDNMIFDETLPDRVNAKVYFDRCAGCQDCLVRCPVGAISLDIDDWVVRIDEDVCVGCRQCERLCAFSAIEISGPVLVGEHIEPKHVSAYPILTSTLETRLGYRDLASAQEEAARCLNCPDPTCVRGCPAHNNIPAFIQAITEGEIDRAKAVLAETTYLSDVCSRVCNQSAQCEGGCSLALAGEAPVAIGALERFVADNAAKTPTKVASHQSNQPPVNVAIVGSGPGAIGAAFELLRSGANVEVFEKDAEPGGLLRYGIPDFTLPVKFADRPWNDLKAGGVQLRTNTEITEDDIPKLLESHDAVILAHGAGVALNPPAKIFGDVQINKAEETLEGLGQSISSGYAHPAWIDRDVLIIGGGNTAMDVGRMAVRNGARSFAVEWMNQDFSPVRPDELAEAKLEGVQVSFQTTALSLTKLENGKTRAKFAQTTQPKATKLPQVVKGSEFEMDFDIVVAALGFRVDGTLIHEPGYKPVRRQYTGLPDRRWQASGILSAKAKTSVGKLALGREVGLEKAQYPLKDNIWVVGDALVGPSTVVEAMAQGMRAAREIAAEISLVNSL